jgi:hypothetical protein
MHRFDYETPLEESLSAFDDLIRAGKVHYIGFSEWNASQIKSALAIQDARGYNRFVSSQPQYSALWRVIEAEVVPLSQKEGIGQIVWSPMAQGVLTGKYLPGKKAPAGSRATDKGSGANMIKGWLREEVLEAVQNLKPIADQAGLTMSQLAIAWVLQNPNVSCAIMGETKTKQVKSSYKFSNGFAVNFDMSGDLLKQQSINIKQTSSELDDVLAINNQLSVAICNRGDLIVTNLKNLRENNIYKLSTENNETKNNQFIAKYQNVKNWYGNYFIADGSRVKFEVIKEMSASKEKPSRPQKRRRQIPETNVKKIVYLSKILNS